MKKIIIYFFILLFSVCAGVFLYHNTGYILIAYKDWSIETSLWFGAAVTIAAFVLGHLLLRLISKTMSLAAMVKAWLQGIRKRRARRKTMLGLYSMLEGDWLQAEKKLFSGAKYSDMPLVNYLFAAHEACRQQAFERSENYLFLAQQAAPEHQLAIGFKRAEMYMQRQQWEQACAILQDLHASFPKNIMALRFLVITLRQLHDWDQIYLLLPKMRKISLFREDCEKWELETYCALLPKIAWSNVPSHLQKAPQLVAIYVRQLLADNQAEQAEDVLKMILRKNLDPGLLALYASLPSSNPIKKLARAEEAWLQNNPEDPALFLALGRMCGQQKLWGKARQYLERSASLAASAEVYFELGQICDMQHDLSQALEFYKKGSNCSLGSSSRAARSAAWGSRKL